jgi:hypothetical protein
MVQAYPYEITRCYDQNVAIGTLDSRPLVFHSNQINGLKHWQAKCITYLRSEKLAPNTLETHMAPRILQALIAVSMEKALKGITVEIREVKAATISKEIAFKAAAIGLCRDSGEEFENFCKALAEV